MTLLSYIYCLVTNFRNFLYDLKILKINKIENLEIICIGNITVGGTGKTPAVQYFVKRLIREGKKVAVVSRGYGGKRKEDLLVLSDGENIYCTAFESGDEAYLHALNLKVPVIVSKNRYRACLLAKEKFNVDTVVLDDGFQHRSLYRDRDIVLIDATNPFGNSFLLPKGLLREDFNKAANRASEFIITKSDLISKRRLEAIKRYMKMKFKKNVSLAKHEISSLYSFESQEKKLSDISGKKVLLFSALANPLNFKKTIAKLNPAYIESLEYKDHYNFKEEDLSFIKEKAIEGDYDFVITTEKDLVKLPKELNIDKLHILKIEFTLIEDKLI